MREARNDVMHSALMKITALEFQTHSGAIIDLLEDGLLLCTLQDAKDAVLAVKEVP